MPQQLIYTSAARGVLAGRSGYCTVARTAEMREPLALRLEQLSYYDHLTLKGGQKRSICILRNVDIRGVRYFVLSRIRDAGLDFTGRTNFIAHHLAVVPEEISELPIPAVIFSKWNGWKSSWEQEPKLFEKENWCELKELSKVRNLPAKRWRSITGDAVNAYSLLEASGTCFLADGISEDDLLGLIAEATELLEVRDIRRDYRSVSWHYTFTTSLQEQDNASDFRWKWVHSDNPVAAKVGECMRISSLSAKAKTDEEAKFAIEGWLPVTRIQIKPSNHPRVGPGDLVKFTAEADGVPEPSFQWFEVKPDTKTETRLEGQTRPQLEISVEKGMRGLIRFIVEASNRTSEATIRFAVGVEVDSTPSLDRRGTSTSIGGRKAASLVQIDDDEEKEYKRKQLELAEKMYWKKRKWKSRRKAGLFLLLMIASAYAVWFHFKKSHSNKTTIVAPRSTTNQPTSIVETNGSAKISSVESNSDENVVTITNSPLTNSPGAHQSPLPSELPAPWRSNIIGNIQGTVGVVTNTDGFVIHSMQGSFVGNVDTLLFINQTVSGDTEFAAKVVRKDQDARAGIMLRESEDAHSPFVFAGVFLTNKLFAFRDKFGEKVSQSVLPGHCTSLKINRNKDHFETFFYNGTNWQSLGVADLVIRETNYSKGFVVCSGTAVLKDFVPYSRKDPKK